MNMLTIPQVTESVDSDGGYSYTGIQIIRLGTDNGLLLWPNPASSVLYVQTLIPKGSLQITDMNGRIVYNSAISNTIMTVPVHQLRTGQYILLIRQNGEVYTKPFIRE
jgi:Secretion system C-terminal sorting domain